MKDRFPLITVLALNGGGAFLLFGWVVQGIVAIRHGSLFEISWSALAAFATAVGWIHVHIHVGKWLRDEPGNG